MIRTDHSSLLVVAFTTLLSPKAGAPYHVRTPAASIPKAVIQPRPPLRHTRPHLASRGLSLVQRYAFYAALVRVHHGRLGTTTVVGLRGLAPNGKRHPSGQNASNYDDTFVILQQRSGKLSVTEMLGSTHAGQESSTLSPGGVAQIQPGNFKAVPAGEHEGMPCYSVRGCDGKESVPCWRDVDRDGRISPAEKRHSRTADGILFHNGRFSDHGSSIGCQTLPPEKFQRFLRIIGANRSFYYTLVDANLPN